MTIPERIIEPKKGGSITIPKPEKSETNTTTKPIKKVKNDAKAN